MKKIALLLALLCAGALIGMEKPETTFLLYGQLPQDLRTLIISYITTYNDIDDAINTIKAASVTNKNLNSIVNDLRGFTALVHMLKDKFNEDTYSIALKFNIPVAKTYVDLGDHLFYFAKEERSLNEIAELIKKGADVNFNTPGYNTPLSQAIKGLNIKGVRLLLNARAKPTDKNLTEAIEIATMNPDNKDAIMIKELLEQARQK